MGRHSKWGIEVEGTRPFERSAATKSEAQSGFQVSHTPERLPCRTDHPDTVGV
jgi:hypothetical protein